MSPRTPHTKAAHWAPLVLMSKHSSASPPAAPHSRGGKGLAQQGGPWPLLQVCTAADPDKGEVPAHSAGQLFVTRTSQAVCPKREPNWPNEGAAEPAPLSPAEAGCQVRPRLDPVRQDRGASAGLSGQEMRSVTGSPSGVRERVGNTRS